MKILMALSQTEVTGAEVYATTLADALIERGHEVLIVSDVLGTPTRAQFVPLALDKRSFWRRAQYLVFLVKFIRKNGIQLVHAHSRASMWISYFASRIAGIPMVSTIHALEPSHFTRRLIPAFGDQAIAVCENAKRNAVEKIGFPAQKIEVLPNGFRPMTPPAGVRPERLITLIGRLSSTKGEAAFQLLENVLAQQTDCRVAVVGGRELPERFRQFADRVQFVGHVTNVAEWMARSAVVIGSGRVAVESLLLGRPTLAFGAFSAPGLVTDANLPECLSSNFGDISPGGRQYDWAAVRRDLARAQTGPPPAPDLVAKVRAFYDLPTVVTRLEAIYRSTYVRFHRREVPILCYHRLVETKAEAGVFPTHIHVARFEQHLRYLAKNNYQTLFFSDLENEVLFQKKQRAVVLTFDDGYLDNHRLLLPLLKKYGAKAVIYILPGQITNAWDALKGEKALPLMQPAHWRELLDSGLVEFGAHTLNHPDLTEVTPEAAAWEIGESKRVLEKDLGVEVRSFAYPYGRLNEAVKAAVKRAGFRKGVATDSGPLVRSEDDFEVRRIVVFPNTSPARFARKVSGRYLFRRVQESTEQKF